jgi:hypothetical protein
MNENKPNIKTYSDLLADTENTWEVEESLEELLFDCDDLLEETVGASPAKAIRKGDIIMANNGSSARERGMPIESPHRVFIIEDAEGPVGERIFKGYLLSSQIRKANYHNKEFPRNLYIQDYSTILARGPALHKEAFINLSDLYVIEESKMISDRGMWKGHATQEFISFIDKAIADLQAGKSTEETYWLAE